MEADIAARIGQLQEEILAALAAAALQWSMAMGEV